MKSQQSFDAEEGFYRKSIAPKLRELILGGQDGLVNVLGIVLGVATATATTKIVLIAALAATFAESISMGAVAYTSTKAAYEYYKSKLEKEKHEIETIPEIEKEEVREIYRKKGFRGRLLEEIVAKITSSKKVWLDTMMAEELRLFPEEYKNPLTSGFRVGFASFAGSFVPIIPFFLFSVQQAVTISIFVSVLVLFFIGAAKAKLTIGDWKKQGLELAAIGTSAALVGYVVGLALQTL
ncbi:MAG: VIT1/CCC1 transporter family protein [Candidatus Woesearchaeota archaeon]